MHVNPFKSTRGNSTFALFILRFLQMWFYLTRLALVSALEQENLIKIEEIGKPTKANGGMDY